MLTQNDSMLMIQRNLNTTFILLLFSLLGTIFGLLGTFRSIMIFSETQIDSIQKKIEQRKALKEMVKRAKYIVFNCVSQDEVLSPAFQNAPDLNTIPRTNEDAELCYARHNSDAN
jgi:hypothetical protein